MKLRTKSWLIAWTMITVVAGCQEPKEIMPVAPPGFEIARIPTTKQETAQAVGETGNALKTSNTTSAIALDAPTSPPTAVGKPTTTSSGLVYETLKEGTGLTAQGGQTVTLHYNGSLTDGTVFDSSRKRNEPIVVTNIGRGRVIDGWNEGVPGMRIGERRKLTIPPNLGYGAAGKSPVPPNATLIFEVELLDAK